AIGRMVLAAEARTAHVFFFFQAEDGIRAFHVTGVQTLLFRSFRGDEPPRARRGRSPGRLVTSKSCQLAVSRPRPRHFIPASLAEIGRASCRESVARPVAGEWANGAS